MLHTSSIQLGEHLKNDKDIKVIFDKCFLIANNTVLKGGANEPLYEPANSTSPYNVIYYKDDYFSSALHEIAHWCIAGKKRRTQTDYGYWYSPDGRTKKQQQAFERVEIKPQAIEWAFSIACNIPFRVSIDNLNAQDNINSALAVKQEAEFTQHVYSQLLDYISQGFGSRATIFLQALHAFYNTETMVNDDIRFKVNHANAHKEAL